MLFGPRPLTRTETACLLPLVVVFAAAAWMGAVGCTVAPPRFYRQPDYPVVFAPEGTLEKISPGSSESFARETLRTSGAYDRLFGGTDGYREPQITLVAKTRLGDGWIEAYEIEMEHQKGRYERVWLYFFANRFIRWGPPFQWPAEADVNQGLRRASDPDW